MVEKIKFENRTNNDLQVCIEPFADFIDWNAGRVIEIEVKLVTNEYNDVFDLALTGDTLVIYEARQYEMKVFVDKELKYQTPPGRYL